MPGKRLWFFLRSSRCRFFSPISTTRTTAASIREKPTPDQYQPDTPYARPGTVLQERSRFDPAFTVVDSAGQQYWDGVFVATGVWFTARGMWSTAATESASRQGPARQQSATRAIASACRHRRAFGPGAGSPQSQLRGKAPGEPARLSRRISRRETRSGREQPDRASCLRTCNCRC